MKLIEVDGKPPVNATVDSLRKEAARGVGDDGSECCYAPKYTCCDPALLLTSADLIEHLADLLARNSRAEGPVSDAEVEAALIAWMDETAPMDSAIAKDMRRVLEAARKVRT